MSDEKDKKIDNLNCLNMPKSDWESKSATEKIELIKKLNLKELNEECLSGFTRLHRDARWTNYSRGWYRRLNSLWWSYEAKAL